MEAVAKTPAAQAMKPRHVLIVGKVVRVRRYEGKTYTAIICPAADEYSKPQEVEIRSKARFGEVDEKVTVTAVLGGYSRKPYNATDKETGEVKSVTPVDLYLDLLED